MWQRFTESARKVVFYAQEEAQKYGEGYVSTEHMLLGITREPNCQGAKVLQQCGVSLTKVREEIEKVLTPGESKPSQDMTLTPRGKRVIDLAYDEARNLMHNYIGTEHLLLGLIREGDGIAAKVLAKLKVELRKAREVVARNTQSVSDVSTEVASPESRDVQPSERLAQVLFTRKRRMPADQLCLMLLFEQGGAAANAVIGCDADSATVAEVIEEELLERKTADELKAGFLGVSALLVLAGEEAKALGQHLNASHFLLAALVHKNNATARSLEVHDVTVDNLRAWINEHPKGH